MHADHQPGDHCAEAQFAVDEPGQHGQRNADIQVADECEQDDGNDLQRDRQGALGI
ncbi:hypothetical protein D3C84_1281410 [compost metagenome]